MSSTSGNKSSTQTANTRNAAPKSIKIKLKVPAEILAKFPHNKATIKSSEASSPAVAPDGLSPLVDGKEVDKVDTNGDKASDKKAVPVKAGVKRDATAMNSGSTPKPRPRPAPKRRKIETEDQQPWTVTATGPGAHKLGPKANQGAINAGLRALDRTGKPCRKWGKRTFSIRTFNGSEWSLNHWTAPPKTGSKADGIENDTPSTNSDNNLPSSNVPSVASHQPGENKDISTSAASPIVAASA